MERGIALTPYSYERLDGLKGYESGMPNPGFYHQAWEDGPSGLAQTHRRLLARVARVLRERGQPISAADLIAAETTARGLAALRGHAVVWRRDLVDGIAAALVKDESGRGQSHPLLDAVHEVFRGGERGRLAEGTALPPLVARPEAPARRARLRARSAAPRGRARPRRRSPTGSRAGCCTRSPCWSIAGFTARWAGPTSPAATTWSRCWERWRIAWSPDLDASAIEAARYGPTLAEAAAARLLEAAARVERDAGAAARLLLDAVLAGLDSVAGDLQDRLAGLDPPGRRLPRRGRSPGPPAPPLPARRDPRQPGARGRRVPAGRGVRARALAPRRAGAGRRPRRGAGRGRPRPAPDLRAMLPRTIGIDRAEFVDVLARVGDDASQSPVVRGAAFGALWTLGAADPDRVRAELRLFADPSRLGDFLTGLFGLAARPSSGRSA